MILLLVICTLKYEITLANVVCDVNNRDHYYNSSFNGARRYCKIGKNFAHFNY